MADEGRLDDMQGLIWKLASVGGGIFAILFVYFVNVNANQDKNIDKKSDKTTIEEGQKEDKQEHKEIKASVIKLSLEVKGATTEIKGMREDMKEIKAYIKNK